jgi:hypothetical protein
MWKHVCSRKEVEIVWKEAFHFLQMSSKLVLPSDIVHTWEMVDLLPGLHTLEELLSYRGIKPADIPVCLLSLCQMPFKVLALVFDDIVLGMFAVEVDEPPVVIALRVDTIAEVGVAGGFLH